MKGGDGSKTNKKLSLDEHKQNIVIFQKGAGLFYALAFD